MPDLVFTIKTPAELQGAEAAAAALEVNIGKAKALGKEYGELETRLTAVRASIASFKATPSTDTALKEGAKDTLDLGKKTEEATEKTKLFEGHSRELRKTIRELSHEFPLAGLALRAFANPIAATLTVAIGVFVAVKRHIDELNEKLTELEANARRPLSSFADALRAVQDEAGRSEAAAALDKFADSIEQIHTRADAAINSIHGLEAAQKELTSAREAEALARVNVNEAQGRITPVQGITQRQAIRDKFASEQKDLADQAQAATISAREKELRDIAAKQSEASRATVSPEQETKLKALADARKKEADQLKERAEKQKFDESGVPTAEKDTKGKTIDERMSELDTKIDAIAQRREFFVQERDAKFVIPGERQLAQRSLDTLETERDALIKKRDSLAAEKQGLLDATKNAEALAAQYAQQAAMAEGTRKKTEELTKELEKLQIQLEALKESARLSTTKGEETFATQKRTRALDADKEIIEKEKTKTQEPAAAPTSGQPVTTTGPAAATAVPGQPAAAPAPVPAPTPALTRSERASTVSVAAEGADVIRAGGQATDEQKRAIAEAAKLLDLTRLNSKEILRVLSGLNDSQLLLDRALNQVEEREAKKPTITGVKPTPTMPEVVPLPRAVPAERRPEQNILPARPVAPGIPKAPGAVPAAEPPAPKIPLRRAEASQILTDAAEGADVVKAGGKASESQKAAMGQAQQLLGLIGQNSATTLNILAQLNDDQAKMDRALKTIQASLNSRRNP